MQENEQENTANQRFFLENESQSDRQYHSLKKIENLFHPSSSYDFPATTKMVGKDLKSRKATTSGLKSENGFTMILIKIQFSAMFALTC